MMISSPLRFYSDVIEYKLPIRDVFEIYNCRTVDLEIKRDEDGKLYIEDGELIGDSYVSNWRLADEELLLQRLLHGEKRIAIERLNELLAQGELEEHPSIIKKQLIKLTYLNNLYDEGFDDSYPLLLKDLQDLKSQFESLLVVYEGTVKKNISRKNTDKKVIWNGTSTLLASLFLELGNLKAPRSNKPLIEATVPEIINLIETSFLDSNEGLFDSSNLTKYLTGKRNVSREKIVLTVV